MQYKRNLPIRGFRPGWYLVGMGAVMTWGFWKFGKGQRELQYVVTVRGGEGGEGCEERTGQWLTYGANSEYAREKMWARIHLMPLLQAEEDRDQVRRHYADQARAKELLGENDIRVYYSDRYGSMIDAWKTGQPG